MLASRPRRRFIEILKATVKLIARKISSAPTLVN